MGIGSPADMRGGDLDAVVGLRFIIGGRFQGHDAGFGVDVKFGCIVAAQAVGDVLVRKLDVDIGRRVIDHRAGGTVFLHIAGIA